MAKPKKTDGEKKRAKTDLRILSFSEITASESSTQTRIEAQIKAIKLAKATLAREKSQQKKLQAEKDRKADLHEKALIGGYQKAMWMNGNSDDEIRAQYKKIAATTSSPADKEFLAAAAEQLIKKREAAREEKADGTIAEPPHKAV